MIGMTDISCPCGKELMLQMCCGRYHQGENAPTPEALMRSRYAAFALGLNDYLLATWHPSTRPVEIAPDPQTEWKSLSIVSAEPPLDDKGYVHFRAIFCEYNQAHGHVQKQWLVLEESSHFVKQAHRWWYVDGDPKLTRLKPRRNDPCPCASGRKLKRCCDEPVSK